MYFDLRSEWDLLQNAKLYVPNLVTMVRTRRCPILRLIWQAGGSQ